jgi:hypothetical protein
LVNLGCVNQLLNTITSSNIDDKIQTHLINILKALCLNDKGRKELFSGNNISTLLSQLQRSEVLLIFHSLTKDEGFVSSLSDDQLTNIIQSFLKIISSRNQESTFIMLDIISKISKNSYNANVLLVKFGLIPVFYQFLRNDNLMIITCELLSNISTISEIHHIFLEQGILEALLEILQSILSPRTIEIDLLSQKVPPFQAPSEMSAEDKLRLVERILSSLTNLSLNETNRKMIENETNIKIILSMVLENQSPQILSKCLDILTNLSYDEIVRKTILQSEFIMNLFELLSEHVSLTTNILSFLIRLTTDKINAQIFRDYGVMPLVSLLSNTNDYIVIQSLQIFSNLIRYDECRIIIQSYIDYQVLSELKSKSNIGVSMMAKEILRYIGK